MSACVCHANFAGDIFRHEFRWQNVSPGTNFSPAPFSPAPFFAGSIFRRTHPSCWVQKHQFGISASFSKRQAKQPQATFMHPLVTGENSHFYSFIMTITTMSTTHSNFRIMQLKFFAGVSFCWLVAITFWQTYTTSSYHDAAPKGERSGTEKQPNENIFGQDAHADTRADIQADFRGRKLSLCADVPDPKTRTSMTQGSLTKT